MFVVYFAALYRRDTQVLRSLIGCKHFLTSSAQLHTLNDASQCAAMFGCVRFAVGISD